LQSVLIELPPKQTLLLPAEDMAEKAKSFLRDIFLVALVFSSINAVNLSLAAKVVTRETVTPDMKLDYSNDDQDDLNFRNVKLVFYALNVLEELIFSAELTHDVDGDYSGMDRFDVDRRFLLPLLFALGSTTQPRTARKLRAS